MVPIIASYLLSDTEFNLTMFSTLLHCKDGKGGHLPQMPHAGSANDTLVSFLLPTSLATSVSCLINFFASFVL